MNRMNEMSIDYQSNQVESALIGDTDWKEVES